MVLGEGGVLFYDEGAGGPPARAVYPEYSLQEAQTFQPSFFAQVEQRVSELVSSTDVDDEIEIGERTPPHRRRPSLK